MAAMDSLLAAKHALLLDHTGLSSQQAQLVMAVLRTAALIDRDCTAQLADFELTEARFAVLLAVSRAEAAGDSEHSARTPAAIAAQLDVSRAAVTGLIDGLARQGLVTRATHTADRRSLTVTITEAGRAAVDALQPVYTGWLSQLTAGIDAAHANAALAALSTLQRNLADGPQRG